MIMVATKRTADEEVRYELLPGLAVELHLTRYMLALSDTPFRWGDDLLAAGVVHSLAPQGRGHYLSVRRPGTVVLRPDRRRQLQG